MELSFSMVTTCSICKFKTWKGQSPGVWGLTVVQHVGYVLLQ